MNKIAFRQIDGTIRLAVTFPVTTGGSVEYDEYFIYRKEEIYPTNTTGYLIDSGVLNPAEELEYEFVDSLNIKEGTVYYYSVYRGLDLVIDLFYQDYCMGLVPDFSDIMRTLTPKSMKNNLPIMDNTNPKLYLNEMLGIIAGETEALIRCMPKMMDIWKTDPKIFENLIRMFNWRSSPLLNALENKQQVAKLMSTYYPNKGQLDVLEQFFTYENKSPARLWEWHRNLMVDVTQDEANWGFEEWPLGVWDGSSDVIETLELLPIPYSIKIKYWNTAGELITNIDTPEFDIDGEPTGTGEFIADDGSTVLGTVNYTTGVVEFTPEHEPQDGDTLWIQYNFEMDLTQVTDYYDLATVLTRRGTFGDKFIYSMNLFDIDNETTSLGTTIYLYLNVDIGVEAYLHNANHTFAFNDGKDNTYEEEYFSNLLYKADRMVPLFGYNKFCLVDRIVVDLTNIEEEPS